MWSLNIPPGCCSLSAAFRQFLSLIFQPSSSTSDPPGITNMKGEKDLRAAPNPQTQCKLFALPAELRNEIYTLVLRVQPNNNDYGCIPISPLQNSTRPSVLSLLQTCRLICDEAEGIFYNCNHIEIYHRHLYHPTIGIATFIRRMSSKRLASIRM
jgi:hypothetical protein